MTLEPLLDAPTVIQIHVLAAIAAFGVGTVQLVAPKGTIPHRVLGWSWVLTMAAVALSSGFIHTINLWHGWSPLHLLSILVLVSLLRGVSQARRHQVRHHARTMTMLFGGALLVAGAFTLLPGRLMHEVVFGP